MTPVPHLQASLDALTDRLVLYSKFPKYSLERRIDIFLVPFLERFVSARLGRRDVHLVAPEFPILADLRTAGPLADPETAHLTRRTVNVDYLLRLGGGASNSVPEWMFVELKTDPRSFEAEQADLYSIARLRGFARLLNDLEFVRGKTLHSGKYAHLENALVNAGPAPGPIRIAYLAPRRLEDAAMGRAFPRTPQQREAFPSEPARTVDAFFALEDFAEMTEDLLPPEFAPLWPTVRRLLHRALAVAV